MRMDYSAHFTADTAPIRLPISSSIFLSFVNKIPRHLGKDLYPSTTQDLELLILIPAASHLAANCSNTTVFCTKQKPHPKATKMDPVLLEILSINVMG